MPLEMNYWQSKLYHHLQEKYKEKHGQYFSGDITEPVPLEKECPYCATGQGILCAAGHIAEQIDNGNLFIRF